MKKFKISLFFAERILKSLFALASTVIISRNLSKTDFGEYVLYITLFYFSIVLIQFGSDEFIIKKLVQEKNESILGKALKMRIINCLLAIILIFFLDKSDLVGLSDFAFGTIVLLLITYAFSIKEPLFKATSNIKKLLTSTILSGLISLALRLLLFLWEATVNDCLIVLFIEWFIILIIMKPSFSNIKVAFLAKINLIEFYQKVSPLFFSAIAVIVFMRIDQFMISNILGSSSLALYSVGIKIVELFNIVPVVIITYYYSKIYDTNGEEAIKKLYKISISLALICTIFTWLFSDIIIGLLFGNEYLQSAQISKYYSFAIIPIFMGSVSSRYFILNDAERIGSLNVVLAAFMNVGLNYVLIPLMGIMGAVWSSVIAYYSVVFFNITTKLGRKNLKLIITWK